MKLLLFVSKDNRVQQVGDYQAWQYKAGEAVKDLFCVIWFKDNGFYKTTFYSGFMSFRTLELSDLEE